MSDDQLVAADDDLVPTDGMEAKSALEERIPDDPVFADYFGETPPVEVKLPDGVSYVLIRKLTEGNRRRILNEQNKSVRVQKGTGDAIMRLASGDERQIILEEAMCGWNLKTRDKGGVWQPVAFNQGNVKKFLTAAPVEVTETIEAAVRKANPWLLGDISLEDLIKERDRLDEMIEAKQLAEVGNDS